MSTSDQDATSPLTRKQLREIRLTGSTPVITAEQAAQAAAAAGQPVDPAPEADQPAPDETIAYENPPVHSDPQGTEYFAETNHGDGAPLTRRQAREKARLGTASVPVASEVEDAPAADVHHEDAYQDFVPNHEPADDVVAAEVVDSEHADAYRDQEGAPVTEDEDVVELQVVEPEPASAAYGAAAPETYEGFTPKPATEPGDEDDRDDADAAIAPVPSWTAFDSPSDAGVPSDAYQAPVYAEDESSYSAPAPTDDAQSTGERPVVNPAFGEALLAEHSEPAAFTPSFDDLITSGDSTGSQHSAPSALIFTHALREHSLDGPVAATGEVIITGSYELPRGIGSQGHAHGTTDGKDVDAVLIDGELPPASSPTPIAASAAISTLKPAGEVIRPPAPEKGNKLMLTLAITAGGLALVLATALIIAFTTNVI